MTEVIYTETFGNTTDERIDYLSQWAETPLVVERIKTLIDTFEKNVMDNPVMYPACYELTQLGVYHFRQFSFDGFKLIYQYDDATDTVYAMVLISDKQDLQKTLVDYCIRFL
ncbi:type II toxin-antitoxin system RelE/ParE family toxin [Vibrio alginolyticus]|uniref:type II toxin-antitoxin system RelE/ParE family toxin n=1 Tax=Vibrio parahaemolyticus TaxID=670 RepID=UPI00084BAB20|nr:type II toxin-antitoxin system RelE/ParE family toxin [Vibrio parahaemolyticus]EMC2462425.1 type II toxin-antitoxin system RelE/ParE family toxin [Vibrio alginolyticus]MBE3907482.1 type II toxin-antitoxin system RelE/ParE family toxin [Vibrio parahaemolyticus]ODZ33029.1 plasmid stabilization protein [Vibrio parahaemolyticus]ODZ41668.1 plasmid stabilization protein [Vibrio parahaemolyticus]